MLYYAAPMEGFTDRVWRQTHQKWFGAQGAADRYYAPFISPPENRVLIKKKMAELAPAANPGAPVIPQLLAKDGELAAWMIGQLRALGSAGDIDAQLQQRRQQLQQLQGEYDAIALAMTVLDEANTTLQNRFSPALGARAAEIFSKITAGRYQKVLLSRDLSLETDSEGAQRSVQLLSQGAADQLYLAVRLAICDLVLPEDKSVPLILDDALLTFDDDRLHAALDYLLEESEKRQVLLFTCQKREGAYLNGHKNVTLLAI